jgi:hypothetical protein
MSTTVTVISERRACHVISQHRSTQHKSPKNEEQEKRLTADIVELAQQYGRYGYRRIHALLLQAGWNISLLGSRTHLAT